MAVTDILKIEEVDHVYTMKFRLVLEWMDYRLQYYNLKKERSQNSLSLEEIQALWLPFLVFSNTENNEATKPTEDTELTITREGEFSVSGEEVIEEIDIFEGNENRLTFEQVYTKTFKCTYQLQMYPFDSQVCSVILKVRSLEASVVTLLPKTIVMESDTVLTQYVIMNWTLDYINAEDYDEGVQLVIVFRRRILNAILTVYLPTILVLTIVYATNFFKEFFFEAIVSVNLTSLLVLTTLFISVSGSLPQTAYIKMVDVWLIFAQAVPWVEVLLHTWIDTSRTEGEGGREINNHGKSITVGGKDDKEIYMSTDNGQSFTPALTPDVPESNLSKNMERVQVDEKKLVKARKDFYDHATFHAPTVDRLIFITKVIVPVSLIIFSLLYWGFGLFHYYS